MARDENVISYVLHVIMVVVSSVTWGMVLTVVTFIYALLGVISNYQTNPVSAFVFWVGASLAAISFALTWLLAVYALTAGGVFVGARALAANMRIEDRRRQSRQ